MRVLAITNAYPTLRNPGAGTFIERQVTGLRAIGVEVEVLFLDSRNDGKYIYFFVGHKIQERLEKFSAEIIHVMYGGVMAASTMSSSNRSIPKIVSFCGTDLLGARLSSCPKRLMAKAGVWSSKWAARRASGIIVKSRNLQMALPKNIDPKIVRVIPNGVDLERFRPLDRIKSRRQLGWAMDRRHVLFASSLGNPVKRPELARLAVERVKKKGWPVEMHIMTGVAHSEVPVWINASDVLLVTSLTEGSVNIVKEALACNVPVVSLDVGDVAERLKGIKGCFLCAPNRELIAESLEQVFSESNRVLGRKKMQKLTTGKIAHQLVNFYEQIIWYNKNCCHL